MKVILAFVNRDGSHLKLVHELPGTSFNIRWSPDGSRLAFDVYNVQLGVVNADGSGYTILTAAPTGKYSWCEDPQRIVFSRGATVTATDTIFILTLATGVVQTIEPGSDPEVSPSGDKIACLRGRDMFIVNRDGTGATSIADSVSGGLAWSPGGDRIAFVHQNGSLNVIGRAGGNPVQLTPQASTNSRIVSWSPDGQRLTYEHVYGVAVAKSDGSGNSIIAANASSPDWCPDGSEIIYHSVTRGLVRAKPDGTDSAQVLQLDPELTVTWSPVPLK